MNRIDEFTMRVQKARLSFQQAMTAGIIPDSLLEEIAQLKKEERELLREAVPSCRRRVLDKRDPGAKASIILKTKESLEEADLGEEEKELCRLLLNGEPMGDISFPINVDQSAYECMFYMEVHNNETGFGFGDDGSVILLENNGGWQVRIQPILHNILGEKAVMESSSSCLILDLDKQILRLSYPRISNEEDLLKEPLYE